MSEITRQLMLLIVRVGVDLAKNLIQVHAVDAAGRRVVSKAFKREQFIAWCEQLPRGCLVAMEACSSAHHWGRKLCAMGVDARLIAAHFKGAAARTTPPTPRRFARPPRGPACASCRSRALTSRAS